MFGRNMRNVDGAQRLMSRPVAMESNLHNVLFVPGQGVLYAEATDELVEFAELAQIPVSTPLEGKSAFPAPASVVP